VSTTRTYHDTYEHDRFRVQGPLRECRSIQSGVSRLPYYRTPCVCVPDLIRVLAVCVLLCFIKPILGNRYVQCRGFIVSELRETHPRSKIADVRGGNNKPKQIIVNASFCDEIEGSGKCNYDVPSVHELQTPYPLKHVLMCICL